MMFISDHELQSGLMNSLAADQKQAHEVNKILFARLEALERRVAELEQRLADSASEVQR